MVLFKRTTSLYYADVAELADAPDLGSGVYDVGVQVPSSAPKQAGNFDYLLVFYIYKFIQT